MSLKVFSTCSCAMLQLAPLSLHIALRSTPSSSHSEKQAISCSMSYHFRALWEKFHLEMSQFLGLSCRLSTKHRKERRVVRFDRFLPSTRVWKSSQFCPHRLQCLKQRYNFVLQLWFSSITHIFAPRASCNMAFFLSS